MADTLIETDPVEETANADVEAAAEAGQVEQSADAVTEPAETGSANADESGDVVVTIEGESPAPEEAEAGKESGTINFLRKSERKYRERAETAERKLALYEQRQPTPQVQPLGEKPKLSDFDFDEQRHSQALDAWYERRMQAERAHDAQQQRQQAEQAKWRGTLNDFEREKAEFAPKVAGFDELETRVKDALSPTQLGVLLHVGKKRAQTVAALGANPKVLARIAAIEDPLMLAAELRELETKMAVQPRKVPPAPETVVRGQSSMPMSPEKQLAALEAEADRTGDRTKIRQFNQAQRRKAA